MQAILLFLKWFVVLVRRGVVEQSFFFLFRIVNYWPVVAMLGVYKEGEELAMPLTPAGGGHSLLSLATSTFVISLLYSTWVS